MKDPILLAIIGLALLARVAAVLVLPDDLFSRPWEYEEVAVNLLAGNGFLAHYHGVPYLALVHPFYPLLCAAVYWVVGHSSVLAVQIVQSALVVPAAWVSFQLGADFAGRRAGLLAAAGVVLHPALLVFSLRRHPLWLDAVLFLATLFATYRLRSSATTRQLVVLGALFGIAMLSRATAGALMGLACVWLAWQWKLPVVRSLGRAAIVFAVALLVIAPWLARNAVVFQRPVGFVSTDGQNLWLGNNPAATGGALAADGRAIPDIDPALTAAIRGRSEIEQQRVYRQAALDYIVSNPQTAVANYALKLRSFLLWSSQTGAWYPAWFHPAYQAFYLTLLAAALYGAYRLVRAGEGRAVVLCAAFFFGIALLQSVFYVEGRHRWSVESALVVLAACGVTCLFAGNPGTKPVTAHGVTA